MPIKIWWAEDDPALMLIKLQGRLDWEDAAASDATMRAMLESVAHPVDLIIDTTQQVFFSPRYAAHLQELSSIERVTPRLTVFMGNRLAWEMFEAFRRQYGGTDHLCMFANTFEEALEFVDLVRMGVTLTVPPPPFANWN